MAVRRALLVIALVVPLSCSTNAKATHRHTLPPQTTAAWSRLPFEWSAFTPARKATRGKASAELSQWTDVGPVAATTTLGRFARSSPLAYGPHGYSALSLRHPRTPTVIGARYVFLPGQTDGQNAVLASASLSLAEGSVQFAVWPTHWMLFTVTPRDKPDVHGNRVIYTIIARGPNQHMLPTDGRTVYSTVMRLDPLRGSLTVMWDLDQSRSFAEPDHRTGITANWGDISVVQVRRPDPTDGDVFFTEAGSN